MTTPRVADPTDSTAAAAAVSVNAGRRGAVDDPAYNPIGIEGIEFIEYATARPQALGQVLETMGFRPVARHRSREVLLYRQGGMNVVVDAVAAAPAGALPRGAPPTDVPVIAAFALRVRDAAAACRHALERGAWGLPANERVMELNIPAVHGVGASRIYFVDRWREFSIYDVDFTPIPTVDPRPPALAGLHWFGLVQYVGADRLDEWSDFYRELFGFRELPDDDRHGVLPEGRILRSPCGSFCLQLIEPDIGGADPRGAAAAAESLQRVSLGTPDVPAAVKALRSRGVGFVETGGVRPGARGALTRASLGGVMFELVHDAAATGGPPDRTGGTETLR